MKYAVVFLILFGHQIVQTQIINRVVYSVLKRYMVELCRRPLHVESKKSVFAEVKVLEVRF